MMGRLTNEPSIRRLQHKEICNHYYPKLMLIAVLLLFGLYSRCNQVYAFRSSYNYLDVNKNKTGGE